MIMHKTLKHLIFEFFANVKILLSLLVCFFISGCSRKHSKAIIIKPSQDITHLEESVARMTQIPDAVFGFRLQAVIPDQEHEENVQIVYHPVKGSLIDLEMVKKYYDMEMEILGWDLVSNFKSTDELCLLFSRPGNVWCQIILSHENILTVMLLTKKGQS